MRVARRIGLLVTSLALLTACKRTVTYRVTGNASHVDVTYTSPGAVSMSNETVTLPWERTMTMGRMNGPLMVSAHTAEQGVQLECQILIGGDVKAEARTTGGFASPASCSAF